MSITPHFLIFNISLLAISVYLYGFNSHGLPKGHFLDALGLYATIFTPIIFIYIFYVLYKRFLTKKSEDGLSKLDKVKILIFCETRQHLLSKYVGLEMIRLNDKKYSEIRHILKTIYKLDKDIIKENDEKLKKITLEQDSKRDIKKNLDKIDSGNDEGVKELTEEEKNTAAFPSLFMEDKLFQGDKEILKNLEQAIVDYKGADVRTSSTGSIGAVSISLIPVFLAGLLDGINPCVFSTLLFLISSLTLAGRKRKEIFIIGIFFTITVFITYYLVGLGLFQGLRTASVFPFIADIIKYILIFFLILISVLSLYDFVQIKKGRAAKISLQLPKFLKLKIHGVIREQSKSSSIIIGALVLGVMVSVFELACTGQVYFPTIAYLVKLGQSSAYFYLLIYNISFIIPLFIVFVLIYKGTGSKAITGFFQNNMGLMKISLSLLFFILAGVVFLS